MRELDHCRIGICFIFVISAGAARAENPWSTEVYLRAFHENPKQVMNDHLPRQEELGRAATIARQLRPHTGVGPFSELPKEENYEIFLPGLTPEKHLVEMEKRGLRKAELEKVPWSGSYWATRNGKLGWRYADPKFPKGDFKTNRTYFEANPQSSLADDLLSPAEKYDLLVGSKDFAFTNYGWQEGLDAVKTKPDVPKWYGLCHGWAPASYLVDEPIKELKVQARDGRWLTFFPSDIKALASSLWGDIEPKMLFVGKKCMKENPAQDEVGRVIDPECFNTHPGTFHLLLINRLGIAKQSLIFDATYDVEVWNQPITKYEYRYFNPQTQKVSDDYVGSEIEKDAYRDDKFKSYRSPKTKFIVGISLDLSYVVETLPDHDLGSVKAPQKTVRYVYDLELDENREIIGGEWYSNRHPDFVWAIDPAYKPVSVGEKKRKRMEAWKADRSVPDSFVKAAAISSKNGQPLAAVIQALIEKSK